MSKEEEFGEEGARPSSLIPVHRPAIRDPLHDLQLLRDVAIINEQVRRELGPPAVKQRHVTPEHEQEEVDTMKLKNMAAVAAAASVGATSSWSAPRLDEAEEAVPKYIEKYVDENKELLAYKSVTDGSGGGTIAIILRHPKAPDPELERSYEERVVYSCELIILAQSGNDVRVTGRNRTAVDCDWNQFNRRAERLSLNEALEVMPDEVTFTNENPKGGSYSYSFKILGGEWHLSEATTYYKDYNGNSDEVLIAKEAAFFPKDFGLIQMDKFDPKDIEGALSKNKSIVP